MRQTSFPNNLQHHRSQLSQFRRVPVDLALPGSGRLLPERSYERFPYVPSDPRRRDERCADVFHIQVQGLVTRLRAAGIERLVIGISGGLDSTHALLVCAQAMDALGYPARTSSPTRCRASPQPRGHWSRLVVSWPPLAARRMRSTFVPVACRC